MWKIVLAGRIWCNSCYVATHKISCVVIDAGMRLISIVSKPSVFVFILLS